MVDLTPQWTINALCKVLVLCVQTEIHFGKRLGALDQSIQHVALYILC